MSPSWRACFAIWRIAVYGERPATAKTWFVLLSLPALAGALGATVFMPGDTRACVVGFSLPLSMLALFHWVRYVVGATRQNSPANAALVPHLHRNIRITSVLALALSLMPLALLASALDHSAALFIVMAAEMIAQGLAVGGRKEGAVLAPLLVSVAAFCQHFTGLLAMVSAPGALLVEALLTLALARHGLCALFPRAGERHWKLLRRQAVHSGFSDLLVLQRFKRGSGAHMPVYAWMLRRDLRSGAKPENLLMHALGPNMHRFGAAFSLLVFAVAAVLARAAYLWSGAPGLPAQVLSSIMPGAIGAIVAAQALALQRFVLSMYATQGEQALVRLSPAAPDANRLSGALARRLLVVAVGEWMSCTVFALGMVTLFGGGWHEAKGILSVALPCLAAIGWILRDYSRRHQPSRLATVATLALAAASGAVLLVVRADDQLWGPMAIATLLLAAGLLRWRFTAMATAPVQFPAGRFG